MKILFICAAFPPVRCGVGDYTYNIVNQLSEKNCDVSVITSKCVEKQSNFKVKNIIEKWSGITCIRQILHEVRDGKYDVVHVQVPAIGYTHSLLNYLLPLFLKIQGNKVVYTIHEYSDCRKITKMLRIPAIFFSDVVMVVEPRFMKEMQRKFYVRPKNKIRYVNIGSNIPASCAEKFKIDELRKNIIEQTNSKCSSIISYFGFISEHKCIHVILEAMVRLKKRGELRSIFLIIGEFDFQKHNKEYQNKLQTFIRENDLENYVCFTGYQEKENVGDYFRASDAAILLFKNGVSVRNGSMLAAQQEGLSIVTSKPADESYFNKKQFILIDNNASQVEKCILDIQKGNIEKSLNEGMCSWESIAEEHMKIYKEIGAFS